MVLFPAIGLLLWIAFVFALMVLCGIVWVVCNVALWLLGVKPRLTQGNSRPNGPPRPSVGSARAAGPTRSVPLTTTPSAAKAQAVAEIWPKWNASHRRYVDQQKSLWQEQFDSLNNRE